MAREIVKTYKASPKQMQFIKSEKKYVAYGGARGGGKSWGVRFTCCRLCNIYPGIRTLIVRRTFEDVRKNHIDQLKGMLVGIATYNTQDKIFRFRNGSTIEFAYYDSDKDLDHFQGIEWDVIFIDEATQMQEEWLKNIAASCRSGEVGGAYPKRIYYTCNPGGPSHDYIKRLFIKREYRTDEKPEDYEFIQAKVTDNLHLMRTQPEYLSFLRNLSPKLRAAWLDGDWDIYEGQFFEDFRPEVDMRAAIAAGVDLSAEELKRQHRWTHVIAPIRIKAHWPIYRSFDWGYSKPFSCGWWAVDDDGVIFRIAELYGVQYSGKEPVADTGVKWTPEQVFSEIQRVEHEHPLLKGRSIQGIADPAIWDAEHGISIADTAAKYGIFFVKGDHERMPGWMQCHYRLHFDDNGYAMMYVFDTCTNFIRTIPTLQYDEHKKEDLDTHGEDHAADEWRYFCMNRPIKATIETEPIGPKFNSDPLNQYKDTRRHS